MPVRIEKRGRNLYVEVTHPRIDGENHILRALQEGNYFRGEFEYVDIDLEHVEYLNSLGITEFVNIHRRFIDEGNTTRLRLLNVERKVNAILELVEMQKIADIELKTEED